MSSAEAPTGGRSLEGRVAVVTGAGGVGSAVAAALAERGGQIAVWDVDTGAATACAKSLVAQGASARATVVDLRDAAAVRRAADEVVSWAGRLDILALSHGILRTARILELDEAAWDEVLDSNSKGRFLAAQAVVHHMISLGTGGVVVDVGSFTGDRIAPGRLHYCVSNAASEAMIRAMAIDLGGYGIRVVSLSSGPIDTPLLGDRAKDPERMARFLENIPLRRLGRPRDVADAVAFFASDDARYFSGGTVALDGGWTVGLSMPALPYGVYDRLAIGDRFSRQVTLTETHLLLGNMLFADSVPLHVDDLAGRESLYGGRIMPGPIVAGLAAVTLGMNLKGAAIGYLEQREIFKAAVKPGDTITVTWTVAEKVPKERFDGGIVTFNGQCVNQRDEVVLECVGVSVLTNNSSQQPEDP